MQFYSWKCTSDIYLILTFSFYIYSKKISKYFACCVVVSFFLKTLLLFEIIYIFIDFSCLFLVSFWLSLFHCVCLMPMKDEKIATKHKVFMLWNSLKHVCSFFQLSLFYPHFLLFCSFSIWKTVIKTY